MKSNRVSRKTNGVNGKKKKSKVNKLIPPVAMISASMLLMAYSSYAWFSMNTKTTADGMKIRVKAEGGLTISVANTDSLDWKESVSLTSSAVDLFPTSTKNTTDWYHNLSTSQEDPNQGQECRKLDPIKFSETGTINYGVGYYDANSNEKYDSEYDESYFLLNNFKLKSSRADIAADLYINKVEVTGNSASIDKALRVAVVVGTNAPFIFAPCGGTNSYSVNQTETVSCVTNNVKVNNIDLIPYDKQNAIDVKVYCYYEGEDENCFTNNIKSLTTINELSVSVEFRIDPT